MQGKVSIVMTCYNKVEYIGTMFDSILSQEWNNIELILVNDGSTDGTRELIEIYEARFIARGYEVVIIDQQNAGVCAAVKAGLERVTGDYVCLIDADDELSPKYCSDMAEALESDISLDYVACSYYAVFKSGERELFSFNISKNWRGEQLLRFCLLNASFCMSWPYMLRFEYFKKCRIVETFVTSTWGSHEPCFLIPIHAYAGKFKYLKSTPLYFYSCERENAHSTMIDIQKVYSHWAEYKRIGEIVVLRLPETVASVEEKKRFIDYLLLFEKFIVFHKLREITSDTCHHQLAEFEYIREVKASGLLGHTDKAFSRIAEFLSLLNARCICIGAKGKNATHLIPLIKKAFFIPIEFWDENAVAGDMTENGDEICVPDYQFIKTTDIILILPSNLEIAAEIAKRIKQTECIYMLPSEIIFTLLLPLTSNKLLDFQYYKTLPAPKKRELNEVFSRFLINILINTVFLDHSNKYYVKSKLSAWNDYKGMLKQLRHSHKITMVIKHIDSEIAKSDGTDFLAYTERLIFDINLSFYKQMDKTCNRIVIWGAGIRGKRLAKHLNDNRIPFEITDKNPMFCGQKVCERIVKPWIELKDSTDTVIVTPLFVYDEVKTMISNPAIEIIDYTDLQNRLLV